MGDRIIYRMKSRNGIMPQIGTPLLMLILVLVLVLVLVWIGEAEE